MSAIKLHELLKLMQMLSITNIKLNLNYETFNCRFAFLLASDSDKSMKCLLTKYNQF